jgi:hypothetical protein
MNCWTQFSRPRQYWEYGPKKNFDQSILPMMMNDLKKVPCPKIRPWLWNTTIRCFWVSMPQRKSTDGSKLSKILDRQFKSRAFFDTKRTLSHWHDSKWAMLEIWSEGLAFKRLMLVKWRRKQARHCWQTVLSSWSVCLENDILIQWQSVPWELSSPCHAIHMAGNEERI